MKKKTAKPKNSPVSSNEKIRELEKALKEANLAKEKAEENSRAKTKFLSDMSHEIRTPMNAITGMVLMSKNQKDPAELKQYIRYIDVSAQHILRLINDILDMSEIEQGKLHLNIAPFGLRDVIENAFLSIKHNSGDKKQISIDYSNVSDTEYLGDSMRLSQVLINLMSNAVKFTGEDGEISLTIEELKDKGKSKTLKFTVADNGIGIKKELLKKIFKPFEQTDANGLRQRGGAGLGLAISKNIVELMGGKIDIKSKEGEGSVFSFSVELPVNDKDIEEPEQEAFPDDNCFAGKKVLVVDDVEINRLILLSLLKKTGMDFDTAANGKEAVEKIKKSKPGEYSMIFMDVQMPVMDGYEATKKIRKLERKDVKKIKIVAMTANAFAEDVKLALKAGMNAHISKPVESKKLMDVLKILC